MSPTLATGTSRITELAERVRTVIRDRQVPFLAAGLAFYAVLGIFPAVAATVAIFGLVANPVDAERFVGDVLGAAPDDVASLLTQQLSSLTEAPGAGLGFGVILAIVVLLWSASTGTRALIRSVNLVHGAETTRPIVELRAVSLASTAAAIIVSAIVFAAVTIAPSVVPDAASGVVEWGRWPALAAIGFVAITALYEYAPTETPSSGWAVSSLGAVVALMTWLVASLGLTLYVRWVGSINETYGTFGAAVVLLLWLYVTAFAILLGAAVDHAAAEADA